MLSQGYDPATSQPRPHTPLPPLNLNQRQPEDPGGPLQLVPTAPERQERQEQARNSIVPLYKLSRQVVTVPDLWREWTEGLGGHPSIASLDAAYGNRWRSPSERQYYSMRKVIIDEIMAMAGNNLEDQEAVIAAVEALEQQRVNSKASLDKLIKALKEKRKM